jgi:hypothetical protein
MAGANNNIFTWRHYITRPPCEPPQPRVSLHGSWTILHNPMVSIHDPRVKLAVLERAESPRLLENTSEVQNEPHGPKG